MKTESKLIAFSFMALIIGISSVIPLVFLMNTPAPVKADSTDEPWFSIDITYGYWVTSNGTHSEDEPIYYEVDEKDWEKIEHKLGLNTTLNVDTTNEVCDGRIEFYKIEITSDQGLIETMSYLVGTRNSIFDLGTLDELHFSRRDWFDTSAFSGGGASIGYNWSRGTSDHSFLMGCSIGSPYGNNMVNRVTQLRESQTVMVTIYRLGWATFTGDSITFTSANNEVVDQIQLEKYGEEGWLYNSLYSEEELAEKGLT